MKSLLDKIFKSAAPPSIKKDYRDQKQESFNFEEIVKLDLLYRKDRELFKQKIVDYTREEKKALSRQYVSLASAYMRKETDPDGAIIDLEKALILVPEDRDIMYDLGLFYNERKMYAEAEELFVELEKKGKRDSGILCNLAECCAGLGEYERALKYLSQAKKIEKEPDKIEIVDMITMQLVREKETLTNLTQRLVVQPKDLRARLLLAEFYFKKGRYDDCLKELDPVKSTLANNGQYLFLVGSTLLEKGKLDESLNYLEKLVELKIEMSNMDEVYLALGKIYEQKDLFDEAIEQFTQGINLNPENVILYYQRGNVYAQKNMYNEAISDYHDGKQKEMQLNSEDKS